MNALTNLTALVALAGAAIAAWQLINDQRKQALVILVSTMLLLAIPSFITSSVQSANEGAVVDMSGVIGTWYGGGRTSEILGVCMNVGADLGMRIWRDCLVAYGIPQALVIFTACRVYLGAVVGGGVQMFGFAFIGSIMIPLVIGGPNCWFAQTVVKASAGMIGNLITNNTTTVKEKQGYSLNDLEIARRSARIPSDVRDAMVSYYLAAKGTVTDEPLAPIFTEESVTQLRDQIITIDTLPKNALTSTFAGFGSAWAAMPLGLATYINAGDSSDQRIVPILTTPTLQRLYKLLADDHGRLRDKADLDAQYCIVPFVGDGGTATQELRNRITALYSIYNARSSKEAVTQTIQALQANLTAPGASINIQPSDLQAIQERLQKSVEASAPKVEAPDVVPPPLRIRGLDKEIIKRIAFAAKSNQDKFKKGERADYEDPTFLYDPALYGSLVFGSTTLPFDAMDPNYARLIALTQPNNVTNYVTAPGIARDLEVGFGTDDSRSNLDDSGILSMLFINAPAWLGFKIIANFMTIAVPIAGSIIPWVSGLAFMFILASYPIYATTALFPGKWTVLLDWAKGVLWVMSWAVCFQIGRSWIYNQPAAPSAGAVGWGERMIGGNVWQLLGVMVIVAAPAFTTFVLGASASAIQNIGGNLMQMGFKFMGAAQMLGSLLMVAVGTAAGAGASAIMTGAMGATKGATAGAGASATGAAGAASAAGAAGTTAAGSGAAVGGVGTMAGLGAMARGGLTNLASSAPDIASKAMSWAGKAAELGGAAASRFDSLLPNPATGGSGGTGFGSGAHAFGPLRMDERSAGRGAGGRASTPPAPGGANGDGSVSVSAAPGGGAKGGPSGGGPGAALAAAALRTDNGIGPGATGSQLAKSEQQHAAAGRFAGSPIAAAFHDAMAAEAAVKGGSSTAEKRLATASTSVAAAVGSAKTDGDQATAHQAGARVQMARAQHLESQGDRGGAQVCRDLAAGHLVSAGAAAGRQLGAAQAAGNEPGQVAAISRIASVNAAATQLQAAGVGPQAQNSLATLQGGTTAMLQAHAAGNHGASSHAAAGFLATGTAAAPQHFTQAAAVAQNPSVRTAMSAAAAPTLSGGDAGGSTTTTSTQVAQVVRRVALSMEGGNTIPTTGYPGILGGRPS